MITKKVVFEFDDKEYSSFERAVDAVENKIFKHVENAVRGTDIKHSQKQQVMQYILDNKADIVRLLSISTNSLDLEDD
ncbi:MAG: hypothetical protein ACRCTP_03840 [Aeromonas popoffii]|uniref:hypothetical protein n=1 Tax=Aeromonas popoffii TaxID=70856 RepID=UPI003F3F084E